MVTSGFPDPAHTTIGQRIKWARERVGMSRPILGGLVDRSTEWVKAVENGRPHTARSPPHAQDAACRVGRCEAASR